MSDQDEPNTEWKLDSYYGLILPSSSVKDPAPDPKSSYIVTTQGCGGSRMWLKDGTNVVTGDHEPGCEHGAECWAMQFPGSGTDPTWVEDTEQPYDNWRSYHTRDGWYTLLLKHDGCVELSQAANVPFFIDDRELTSEERDRVNHDCDEMIHMCDVRTHIELLQSALPLADKWENRPRTD